MRAGRPTQSQLQPVGKRPRRPRQPAHWKGKLAEGQYHRLEELQHAKRLPLRYEDLHGVAQCAVGDSRLRRLQSHAADVLLPQALLQRPEQILLPPGRGGRTLMLGFETILPFLRPLEPFILDDSVSEIMVNGSSHMFIERAGMLEEVPAIRLTEQSLMAAVKNIARRTIT